MSENIQAISQGNYVLHNIDAKKLYVQEPLFTANSGDAVYVGWRPDETVLFDNNKVGTSAVSLSESRANFEELKLYVGYNGGYNTLDGAITITIPSDVSASWLNFTYGAGGSNAYYAAARLLWDSDTSFTITHGTSILKPVSTTAVNGITAYNAGCQNCISKVIGINRKENA